MIDRATLAAIHVAKKDRGLDDDAYRDMMERVAGVRSASHLDANGARLVMLEFERLGFNRDDKPGTAGDRRPIVHKARALWISLYQLDEVANRSDKALDAFTERTTGKQTLRFATNGEAGKVVEALKSWARRVGIASDTTIAVVREQMRRLDQAATADNMAEANPRDKALLDGYSEKRLRELASTLGERVRRLKLGHRHKSPSQTEGA